MSLFDKSPCLLHGKSPVSQVFVINNQQQLFNITTFMRLQYQWGKQEPGQNLKKKKQQNLETMIWGMGCQWDF